MKRLLTSIAPLLLLSCSTQAPQNTLRDVDVIGGKSSNTENTAMLHNETAIRDAYAEYLRHASKQDISRNDALLRLAQLEFELNDKLARNKGEHSAGTLTLEDNIHNATLDRSIEFLETSLRDYPDAKNNDKSLYHLARAYNQKGEHDKSIATLMKLSSKYPKSTYYVESQFRIAEAAFSRGEYSKAEDIYTDLLVSRDNKMFKQNARYKRGWARFKQEYYHDAADDFVQVINESEFNISETLGDSARNQFEEYFNTLGLSFAYMGGAAALTSYFADKPDFAYIYETYIHVSEIFRKQQSYSDAAGILEKFSRNHPDSVYVPDASLRIIEIWKDSGFSSMAISSLEDFYNKYHPQHSYWSESKREQNIYKKVTAALKDNIVLAASHFHQDFNKSGKKDSFEKSRAWYERYLRHYKAYSQKDNIHYLYAELLHQNKQYPQALHHYEQAAYDADIILNKDAAYASILLASQLHRDTPEAADKREYLNKLIRYSLLYTRLYPNDADAMKIMTHAAQESYLAGFYIETISLTEQFSNLAYTTETYNIHVIKAHAYARQGQFSAAEAAYKAVLANYLLDDESTRPIRDNLAIVIYNQATDAQKQQNTQSAIAHYVRITDIVPESDVAATGLYDAIALSVSHEMWDEVIQYIRTFQTRYPTHKYSNEVSKKLSIAYLKSNRNIEAANELEKIARTEQDAEYKIAALWKAAELYEANKDYPAAIRTFAEYAKTHQRPYPQYLEAMHKLVNLTMQTGGKQDADQWRQDMLTADKRTPSDIKTERTRFIASQAALDLARDLHHSFAALSLTTPLEQSLPRKKQLMQEAVNLYGQASSYRISETATEAVHTIGDIYLGFSKALLESERPTNLDALELEQYNILLEDQAFPFEEKAIEFYETNLTHVKDGVFDNWILQSQTRLAELYPARYNRDLKLDAYINVLH
jgi:tetratricopeptide (TPR) repeat protein